ncbi:glycosyltransferase family 2 protein [Terriglobus aquaticus]|uniref:Glycosyltransferase n=1 Tax=Terriglobus aquaticus TaxID=940139 RepID=A0ABW9KNG4_9BACT|nr:glycosyltransferase family 2 protein [Terriglobus aquaticus]
MAVLIPARNEEQLLPRCLRSVQIARTSLPSDFTSDVVVVSDRSSDRTREIAEEILGHSGAVVCTSAGVVGMARALAARVALQRFSGLAAGCWFANTDADCEVPPTWLTDQLRLARDGADAVAGIVDVHDFSEHRAHVALRFRDTYCVNADGTHPHVHGANLGVRADAYLRAGGWAAIATAEDHDLWGRLHGSGHARVSDAALQVITSGRRVGRAPHGFADALAAHNGCAA